MALHQSLERRLVPRGRESVQKLLLGQARERAVAKEPPQLMNDPALPLTNHLHACHAPASPVVEKALDHCIAVTGYCAGDAFDT